MPSEAMAETTESTAPRRLHPLTLLFESIRIGRALILPAIAGAVGTASDDPSRAIALGLGILAIPTLAFSIGKYVSFRYRRIGDELILDSGVIQRQRRIIPLARVQNIDVRQNLLERIFDVAELRVETAGGTRTEAVLAVLSRSEADSLRAEFLGRRDAADAAAAVPTVPETEVLAHLSTAELSLAGATANEVGLVAAAIGGALQFLDDFALERILSDLDPESLIPAAPAVAIAGAVVAGLVLLVVAGWVLSVAGTVIGYHDLTLERTGDELHERYGLLARREASLPLRRVQAVRLEESLLRRPLGLAALRIETAGSAPGQRQRGKSEAFVPLVRRADAPALVARVLDGFDLGAIRLLRVHPRARRRIFVRYSVPVVVAAGVLGFAQHPGWLALLLLLAPARLLAEAQYRHRGYALVAGHVVARHGVFNRVTCVVPTRKVQTLHVQAAPFQRRHGLATLIVDSAGGTRGVARVIDLAEHDAYALLNTLAERAGRADDTG